MRCAELRSKTGFLRLKKLKIKLFSKIADRANAGLVLKELGRKNPKMGFLGWFLKNCGPGLNSPILGFLAPKKLILGFLKKIDAAEKYYYYLENL